MSKKTSIIAVSDYKTLNDLCAHYTTADSKTSKKIADMVFRYIIIQSDVPYSMVVTRRTDRCIEMSSALGDEACFTIDCRHNTILNIGNYDIFGECKLTTALNKIAKWFQRENRKLLKARVVEARQLVAWAEEMGIE